ncbi:hypothetical protein HDK77DRAFT_412997 [Phyllosticta capitalensis]
MASTDQQPPTAPSRSPPPPPSPGTPKPSKLHNLTTRLGRILSASAATPLNILRLIRLILAAALHSPSVTGVLLLLLTRGPARVRARLRERVGAGVAAATRGKASEEEGVRGAVRVLGVLFVLGLVRRANEAANRWALSGFAAPRLLGRGKGDEGGKWDFGIVVVTGGCSGIGAEIVRALLEGAGRGKVTIVVVDVQVLPEEFEERDEVVLYFCDLASTASIHEACAAIRNEVGDPSVLINNAGIARSCDLLDDDDAYNDRLFRVNVLALFTLVRAFLPAMLAAKKGHIVTMASTASFITPPGLVDYCASKAAALSLHEGLSTELRTRYAAVGGRHILTTIMHPGWVATSLINAWESSLHSTGQAIATPRSVAAAVVGNVLGARGGQLFSPAHAWVVTALRATPHWLQNAYRDGIGKQTVIVAPTVKGKERQMQMQAQAAEKGYEVLEG